MDRTYSVPATEAAFGEHQYGQCCRSVLKCMVWAGAGVLWTVSGGVPSPAAPATSARCSRGT